MKMDFAFLHLFIIAGYRHPTIDAKHFFYPISKSLDSATRSYLASASAGRSPSFKWISIGLNISCLVLTRSTPVCNGIPNAF